MKKKVNNKIKLFAKYDPDKREARFFVESDNGEVLAVAEYMSKHPEEAEDILKRYIEFRNPEYIRLAENELGRSLTVEEIGEVRRGEQQIARQMKRELGGGGHKRN